MGDSRIGRNVRWLVACVALVAGGDALRAQESDPTTERSDLEQRLDALEALNRRLLESHEALLQREAENRRIADERYQDLQHRYDSLLERLEATPTRAIPPSLAPPPEARAGFSELGGDGDLREAFIEGGPRPTPMAPIRSFDGGDPWRLPLLARFNDGFELASLDDELTLRFHVLDQTDFRNFIPNDQFPARSGLYIPRVRLYLEGELTRKFEYEVSLQRSVEGVWDLLDGNLNMIVGEGFQIQFGRMLVPYSYDWYDHLEQYFITPERGLFPLNYGLSRTAGLMAHGFLREGRLQYAVGGFDGRLIGIADDNTTRDVVGYLNARPFLNSERFAALRHLNIGGSIFGGRQVLPNADGPLPLRTSLQSSENDEASQAASAVFLEFGEGVQSLGDRFAGALHLAWYYRQLSVEAEWQSGRFDYVRPGAPGRTSVPVTGFHAGFGYFLTGEEVEDRSTVVPLRPLELHKGRLGFGAVELFARYSQLDLGESVFSAGLADPDEWTRSVYMTDVGFNWYPNRFVKFYVDWQLPFYASPVLVDREANRYSRNGSMFWVRCQIWF